MQLSTAITPVPVPLNNPVATGDAAFLVMNTSSTGMDKLSDFTALLKQRWQIDDDRYSSICIALTEAVMNSTVHGNREKFRKKIHISGTQNELHYAFTIEDEGEGFDHRSVPNPVDKENQLEVGGRGLFIMRQLADYTYFSMGGKKVKLLFYKKGR